MPMFFSLSAGRARRLAGFLPAAFLLSAVAIASAQTGSVDTNFTANASSTVYGTAVQPDGKVLVAGSFTTLNGVARNRLARFNADNTLDTNFNPNASSDVNVVTVQGDGKILIGGAFVTVGGVARNRIARLNADGTLDAGFNPGAGFNV